MKVLIVSGGYIDIEFAGEYLEGKDFDRVIAADAGVLACRRLSLMPTDILGDFDSLKGKELLAYYQERGVPVRSFPARKDYTDTHLAVLLAADLAADQITILGATGSRYDHALANFSLLQWLSGRGIKGRIIDAHNTIEMLTGPCTGVYHTDKRLPYFSLIAWGGPAGGIDLIGFSYPLTNGALTTDISLGISNELVDESGTIKIKSGNLLVIRSCD